MQKAWWMDLAKTNLNAHPRIPRDVGCVVGDSLGDAEVDEFQGALHKHKVCRLQVTVHHLWKK